LIVHNTRLSTAGDQAFPGAATRTWNDLSQHITSASTPPVLRARLKT